MATQNRLAAIALLASPLLLPTPATAGPQLGLNLSAVRDYSAEYPFVDVFRSARPWIAQKEGAAWGKGDPLELRADGYPASLRDGQFATTIVLNAKGFPTGTYTLLFDGRGRLRLSGDLSGQRMDRGQITFFKGPKPNLMIHLEQTDPSDPLRNIRLYMPGTSRAGEGGGQFAAAFLDRCRRFRCLRFMDWMDTNNSEIRSWDERPKPDDFSWASHGVPAEVMIELANELRIDPWFCMPHLADDDYVRRFAQLVYDRLDPGLTAYVEHSNEVWNGQFAQAKYARGRGRELRLADNDYGAQLLYHAQRSGEIAQIWEHVLGDDRVVAVYAAQSANPWTTKQMLSHRTASRFAEAVAIAPYFGGHLGEPKTAAANAKLSVAEVARECRKAIAENAPKIREHAAMAEAAGCRLIAYEGGQHLVGHGGAENDESLMELFHRTNRDPVMADLYREAIESWAKAGGELWVVFSSVATPSKWGSWGMLEYDGQPSDDAPKWRAIDAMLDEQPPKD